MNELRNTIERFSLWCLAIGLFLCWSVAAESVSVRPQQMAPEMLFEKNEGQLHESIGFRARTAGMEAAIATDGTLILMTRRLESPWKLVIRPEGHRRIEQLQAAESSSYKTNYFGKRFGKGAIVDVAHFGRVVAPGIYPGIDLAYHASAGSLEFDFIASPGSDPSMIRLSVEGASKLDVHGNGDLAIAVEREVVIHRKPLAYQERNGKRIPVDCGYRVIGPNLIGFSLGEYDKNIALVIDPVVEYSSYLGGDSYDWASGVKIGSDGFLYVAGYTFSSNFLLVNAYDSRLGGSGDAFITKINPATGNAVYSTYLGGANRDDAYGLDVDGNGNVYVAGLAGAGFPTTAGAYQTTTAVQAGFVTKLSAQGNTLVYSTLIEGTVPAAIVVDVQGRAAITGTAGSAFVTTPGAFRATRSGSGGTANGDAFLMRLNATGTQAEFATFYGGVGADDGRGLALDPSGRLIIAGETTSADLPMAADSYQPNIRGTYDGYFAVFAPDGGSLVSSTFLGGGDYDSIRGVATDASGNVAVVGGTQSLDFPTASPLLAPGDLYVEYIALRKGFVAKFAQNPLRLLFSTLVGSYTNCCETAETVAMDMLGDVYVGLPVNGAQLNRFATTHPFIRPEYIYSVPDYSGGDAYAVAGIRRDGGSFLFNVLAAPSDGGITTMSVSTGGAGHVAVAAATYSRWLPITPANTQPANPSPFYRSGFVMTMRLEHPPVKLEASPSVAAGSTNVTLVATSFASTPASTVTFWDGATEVGTAQLNNGIGSITAAFPVGIRRITATIGTNRSAELILPVYLPSGVCQ